MPFSSAGLPTHLRRNARWMRLGAAGVPAMVVSPDWEGGAPVPAVIWMHGRTVTKELDPGRYLRWMRAGIGACAVDLPGHGERLAPELQQPEATLRIVTRMIAEIDQVVEALGELGAFDLERLAIGGVSAGGMAALARLCRPHRFRAVSVEASSGSWRHQRDRPAFRDHAEEVDQLDPIQHLDGWREIPVQAIHALHDELVSFEGQAAFIDALRKRYRDPSLIEFIQYDHTGAPHEHAGLGRKAADAKARQLEFFSRRLGSAPQSLSPSVPSSRSPSVPLPSMPSLSQLPDAAGRFGPFGGRYVPETLIAALDQLVEAYGRARDDPRFAAELEELLARFAGRPTPLYHAARLSEHVPGGPRIYLKREDLTHTGAHKINNTIGQALLAARMGKKRVIAETGAGQHGVATATAAAHFGLDCEVYMGAEDVRRQRLNVFRMELLGARVNVVEGGSRTLKDATNEALRDWMGSVEHTHYILGSVVGPHPFPMIVRDFQSVIGRECRSQCLEQLGRLPEVIVACVGGGSNAAGIFYPFIDDDLRRIGVEAGGRSCAVGQHAAPLCHGAPGILHGSLSYVLQDEYGQTSPVHSCSAGLDYPGVGPEHACWKESSAVTYTEVTDDEALDAFGLLSRLEGIIPALEPAHAVAAAISHAPTMTADQALLINLSGRGDKDVEEVARLIAEREEKGIEA